MKINSRLIITHLIAVLIGVLIAYLFPLTQKTVRLYIAAKRANRLIVENPNNARNWMELGEVERKRGNYDESISAYKKAIEVDPDRIFAYQSIAICYEIKGEPDQTEKWLQTALDRAEKFKPELADNARMLLDGFKIKRKDEKLFAK